MSTALPVAAALAAAVGSGAFILTRAKISLPLRLWVTEHPGRVWEWFKDLLSCPFCTSVWMSLGVTGIYRPYLVHMWLPLDFVVTALAIAAGSMLAVLVITKAVMIK